MLTITRPAAATPVHRLLRTPPPLVEPGDGLAAAAARMRGARAGGLPVLDSGRLVGLVTVADLVRAVAAGLSTDVLLVGSYMRSPSCAIDPNTSAAEAAARMIEHRARHLPVIRAREVVGVLSATDLLGEWGVPPALFGDDRFV